MTTNDPFGPERVEPTRQHRISQFLKQEWPYILMILCVITAWVVATATGLIGTATLPQAPALPEITFDFSDISQLPRIIAYILFGFSALILLMASLVCLTLYIIYRIKGQDFLPREPKLLVKWHLWDVVKIAVFCMLMEWLIWSIAKIIGILSPAIQESIRAGWWGAVYPLYAMAEVMAILFGIYMLKRRGKMSLTSLGLKWVGALKNIFRGAVAYVGFYVILLATGLMLWTIRELFNMTPEPSRTECLLYSQWGVWRIVLGVFLVTILGPILEEIFFRGFFLGALRRKFGPWVSIVICSLVFAAIHGLAISFIYLFALGVLLAYLYERTQSLIPSITAHAIHNTLVVLAWLLTVW